MTTINAELKQISANSILVKYEGLGDEDVGATIGVSGQQAYSGMTQTFSAYPDKTIEIIGTWGGATAVIEGSNDGTNWNTLNDIEGEPLSFTEDSGFKLVLENPLYVRPSTSGGTGTDLDVTIVASK